MAVDHSRVLAELALPLDPGADVLEAIAVAVALEDAYGVTIPDDAITAATLGQRDTIEAMLEKLAPPT